MGIMSTPNGSVDIVIDGIPIECILHNSKKGFECYSSIVVDQEPYGINDPILITDGNDLAIARIICIYVFNDEAVNVLVRKHIFSRHVEELFDDQGIDISSENEVVQDLSKNYVIKVNQILRKCALIIMHPDDDPNDIMENNNLNRDTDFVCRFSLKSKKLVPTLTTIQTQLTSQNKYSNDNTPMTYIEEFKQLNNQKDHIFSPPQRNSVRRNLNKSFGNSPQDANHSILNYSIVDLTEDEDECGEKPIKVKLRVSKSKPAAKENECPNSPRLKRTVRQLPRKSYADYISPKKTTPTKRQLSRNSYDSDEDIVENNKVARSTPKGKEAVKTEVRRRAETPKTVITGFEPYTSSGREVKVPKRYEDIPRTPVSKCRRSTRANRNLSMDYNEIHMEQAAKSLTLTRKSTRLDKQFSDYCDEDQVQIDDNSVNLNDSIRTTMLKVHLKNLKIDKNDFDKKKSMQIADNENSAKSPRTPTKRHRRTRRLTADTDTDDSDLCPASPRKSPKTQRTPAKCKETPKGGSKQTPKTPRSVIKLIRQGVVTPSVQARSKSVSGDSTPLMKARSQLHVSYLPKSLPCRENEFSNVYNFLEGKLLDGCGGCMYVSGVPGTGKTATVTSAINDLQKQKNVPQFTYVSINGMRLTEPRQAYVEILKQLVGKTVPWEQAQSMLEELFVKSKKLKPVVMLIDELDILCTKRQDVVYNLLDWPSKAKNQLVVVTIANTMDLPERLLMSRVTSRLGLTRLTFQAYTYKQLQEIVSERLCGTDSFNPDAVQFVARKVASVSGDARRALDICRRAAEIAESEGREDLVNMNHVNQALNAMITQPKVRAIRNCSRSEQLMLQSIVAEVERTGVEETTFADIYKMLISCAAIEGLHMISTTIALAVVAKLSACRLILTDQKCNDIYQRIILNVSSDDIYYALKKE